MNKKAVVLVLVLVLTIFAPSLVGLVNATAPTNVSGTIVTTQMPYDLSLRGKSGNSVMTFEDFTETWQGDINGVASGVSVWEFHGNPLTTTDWSINIHEKFTFDATVDGKSGTLVMALNLVVSITGGAGHWTIISGTDELVNLHGQGTISLAAFPYTYTGQIHFDP